MRCFYVLKKWSSAKLSLNRDLSLNKVSLNRDCTVLCKMFTIVQSMGVGGQNWMKIGPRSCLMPPYEIDFADSLKVR